MDKLEKLRERIDWLDAQIASLLNERMSAADQAGKIKAERHQDVTDFSREEKVLDQVERVVRHPVLKENIGHIYREIMQESKVAQHFFQHLSQPFRRIGIVGVGLMGGSLAKALKTKDPSIEIGTVSGAVDEEALAGGWIDKVYSGMQELVQNAELIVLASPLSTIIPLAEEIKRHCQKKLIVIDIAGVKTAIAATFEKLSGEGLEYISTHPMAGKENGGFANSQATLFVNRPWVVVPHQGNGIDSIIEWIKYLGGKPVFLEAAVHDHQAALVSHLPAVLSKSYFDFVSAHDKESLRIAGPGFQSFTRLARDNGEIENQPLIRYYLERWLDYLKAGMI